MHHNGPQLIQSIRILDVISCVEESQFEWEDDAVGEFGITLQVFLVFESFEMKCQDIGQFFDLHSFFGLLQATALIT